MSSLGRLGIGLSVVFGCFLLALVAELYYVFWWRKRLNPSGGESALNGEVEDEYSSPSRELFYLLCWKKPGSSSSSSLSTRALNRRSQREASAGNSHNGSGSSQDVDDPHAAHRSPDQSPVGTDFVAKFFPVHAEAQGMDSDIMRIHSLLGPPRLLFTIKEETKEDLDSEDGRSRGGKSKRGSRSRSLSDLLAQIGSGAVTPIDTPYVTPPSSPPCEQSPPTAQEGHFHGVSRVSSPPPKFKFLRDADGKESLHSTACMQSCYQQEDCHSEQHMPPSPSSSSAISISSDEDGSFITIIVGDSSSSSSSSQQAPHPSPVAGSNPTDQTMPLSASSPPRLPSFSQVARSIPRKSPIDTIEKQCS